MNIHDKPQTAIPSLFKLKVRQISLYRLLRLRRFLLKVSISHQRLQLSMCRIHSLNVRISQGFRKTYIFGELLPRPFEWYIIWFNSMSDVSTFWLFSLMTSLWRHTVVLWNFKRRNLCIGRKATERLNLVYLAAEIPKLNKKSWQAAYLDIWRHYIEENDNYLNS